MHHLLHCVTCLRCCVAPYPSNGFDFVFKFNQHKLYDKSRTTSPRKKTPVNKIRRHCKEKRSESMYGKTKHTGFHLGDLELNIQNIADYRIVLV